MWSLGALVVTRLSDPFLDTTISDPPDVAEMAYLAIDQSSIFFFIITANPITLASGSFILASLVAFRRMGFQLKLNNNIPLFCVCVNFFFCQILRCQNVIETEIALRN